jgi:hypothetical protein
MVPRSKWTAATLMPTSGITPHSQRRQLHRIV